MDKHKCPACGSTNIVEIMYGLPGSEAFEAEERGELVIGGCEIEIMVMDEKECIINPALACKACEQRFGGNNFYLTVGKEYVRSFDFYIGEFFGSSHYIYIDGKRKNKIIRYACVPEGLLINLKKKIATEYFNSEEVVIKEIKLSDEEWYDFLDKIIDCEVEYWKDEYYMPTCDGTQWHVEVKFPGRERIYKTGSNAYPPSWGKFLRVLHEYTDVIIES